MIQITNNGTKDVCFPNQFGNFCIPSGETCPISVEQFQRLKKNCPDVLGDITVDLGTTPPGFELTNYTILCDTADSSIYYLTYRKQLEDTGVIENITITMPSGVETVGLPPTTAKPCQDSKVVTKCRKVDNGTGYDYYTELICMVGIVVVGDMYLNHQDGIVSTTKPAGAEQCEEEKTYTYCQISDPIRYVSVGATNPATRGSVSTPIQIGTVGARRIFATCQAVIPANTSVGDIRTLSLSSLGSLVRTQADPVCTSRPQKVEIVKTCDDCLTPVINCYCAIQKAIVKGEVKGEKALVREKETSTAKPGSIINVCRISFFDCKGEIKITKYIVNGKIIDEATAIKGGYTKEVNCNTPAIEYQAGPVTCASIDILIDGVMTTVYLNCQIFTDSKNPTNSFTQYFLADNYGSLGDLNDPYTPTGTVEPIPCPPGSITEADTCYVALVDVKGIATTGQTISVNTVTNNNTGNTIYTITHSASNTVIYTGNDPLSAGIDLGDAATRQITATCDEEIPPALGPILEKEVCAFVNGGTQQYCLTRVFSRHPQTGVMTILHYEDSQGNIIDGDVVETCCDGSAVCYSATPSVFRVKDYYSVNSDSFLSNLGSPAPTTYSYRVTNVVVNGTALPGYPITSTAWTSSSNTIVPTQVAPYNTIPAYQNLGGGQWVVSDTNWINFLNSLSIPFFTFQLSPLEETLDGLSIAGGYGFGNPIDSTLVYGDGFQIVYPDGYTFSITVEALYDGVLGHTMVFTESSNIIDGASMTGAPTTGLTF